MNASPYISNTSEATLNTPSVMRSIADTFVYQKAKVIALMRKHGANLPDEPTNAQAIRAMFDLFRSNSNFREEFAQLTANKDFTGTEKYSNAVPVVSAIATSIGSIFGSIGQMVSGKSQEEVAQTESEKRMLDLIIIKEEQKSKEDNAAKYWIVGGVILTSLVVGGIMIYRASR